MSSSPDVPVVSCVAVCAAVGAAASIVLSAVDISAVTIFSAVALIPTDVDVSSSAGVLPTFLASCYCWSPSSY